MRPLRSCAIIIAAVAAITSLRGADFDLAAKATNQLGADLQRQLAHDDDNLCLSPYSIETALAMTFAGADGETKAEMARVLHFPSDGDAVHASFTALQDSLNKITAGTGRIADHSHYGGGPSEAITFSIANRLFGQRGYDFRNSFDDFVHKFYGSHLELLDFKKGSEAARAHINKWVAEQTRDKIRDLIPQGGIKEITRLVLANAIYLKAPWAWEFNDKLTTAKPFHVRGHATVDVPTMNNRKSYGYAKREGFTAVAVPYSGSELQLLVLIPDEVSGLKELESKLSAEMLGQLAGLEHLDVDLELPKFKIEPPTIPLAQPLEALGMKTAFDDPQGSADFDKMAPRRPDKYLAISNVFHKTFIAVDEKGTEAAAATAVVLMELTARFEKPKEPIHVKVERPFLYAIQHVPSGACLFIGRVTDPR